MKNKLYNIIFSQMWWSVGESSRNTLMLLNFADYLKKTYPNKFYIIYNVQNRPSWGNGLNTKLLKHCIDIDTIKLYVDEVCFNNQEYLFSDMKHNGYVVVPNTLDQIFIHETEVDDYIKNTFNENLFEKIISSKNPLWWFPHEVVREHDENLITQPLLKFSDTIKNIANDVIIKNKVSDFKTVFFRWEPGVDFPVEDEEIIVNFWLEAIEDNIDVSETYFLTSNLANFYRLFKKKFPEVKTFFIDRSEVDWKSENFFKNEWKCPDVIPEGLVDVTTDTKPDVAEFLAFVDLMIVSKSKEILNINDGKRIMISLFLWYPLLIESIPVLWFRGSLITKRKFEFNKLLDEVHLDARKIKIPNEVCKLSNGKVCEPIYN